MSALTIYLKKIALAALWALTLALLVLSLGWMPLARATDLGKPLVLVAKPELASTLFRASVLAVAPVGGDQHVGFIVNRSTTLTLGKIFRDHAPSMTRLRPSTSAVRSSRGF